MAKGHRHLCAGHLLNLVVSLATALLVTGCSKPADKDPASAPAAPASTETTKAVAASQPEKIFLFAAASAGTVLDELKAEFEKQHPEVIVRSNYGASSTLAQQIEQGADADLFLSASPNWAEFLQKKDLVAEQHDLLGNTLVVVVPRDSMLALKTPEDLASAEVKHLALADTASVPAGVYAKQALTKLNLWEQVQGKGAAGDDVRKALAFVETGAAEAGIVYETDAAVSDKVKIAFRIDPKLTDPIRYPLVLLKHGADRKGAGARQLYEYLQSADAAGRFRAQGFRVLE